MKTCMESKSKGMTLVEIILVIAIIGILAGSAVLMIGHIRYADTQKTVKTIDSALDKLQIQTMSKTGNRYLYIYHLSNGNYMKVLTDNLASFDATKLDSNGTKLSNDSVSIYMDSLSGTKVDGSDFIKVAYTKELTFDTGNTNVNAILVNGGSTYKLQLYNETGKHMVYH